MQTIRTIEEYTRISQNLKQVYDFYFDKGVDPQILDLEIAEDHLVSMGGSPDILLTGPYQIGVLSNLPEIWRDVPDCPAKMISTMLVAFTTVLKTDVYIMDSRLEIGVILHYDNYYE